MFSSRTMTANDWARIRHFKPIEFPNPERMGYEFLMWLDQLRIVAGVPFVISSSYRSPAHNREVGGASDSAHCDSPCNAIDIAMSPRPDDPNWNYSRYQIISSAIALGCRRIGTYANGSLHLDRSEHERPSPRIWVQVSGHPSVEV